MAGMASNVRKEPNKSPQRLGQAGLALHYANVINQIDNIASRPTSLPPNVRDTLYNGLPPSVKTSLRSRLQTVNATEEFTMALIKAEMEKTLQWLVPVAANTTKAHQGFGWVGEWANTSNEFSKKTATNSNLIRLQTLYHADKQKTDLYILELVIWLHRLINLVRYRDPCFNPLSARSPSQKGLILHSNIQRLPSLNYNNRTHLFPLSQEDKKLLENVSWRRLVPGISKSQEFAIAKKTEFCTLSRSAGSSPSRDFLEHPNNKIIDVMDAVDTTF